jgi:transcriptional regulator with XRE-family HTH domain
MVNKSSVSGFPERLFQAQLAYEGKRGARLTRADFAEMVGVSQPTASDWFNGNRTPSLEQVEMIAKRLGVEPAWLAYGAGDREAHPVERTPVVKGGSREVKPGDIAAEKNASTRRRA